VRVPPFYRYRKWMQSAAFFVCGSVVGAALYSGLASDQYDRIMRRYIELTAEVEQYKRDIAQLNQFKNKATVISSIVVYIEEPQGRTPMDASSQKELKRRVTEDLSIFLGRSVFNIGSDAQLARKLLEGKIYEQIGDKAYRIDLTTVLVAERVLHVWIEARPDLPE
jgi:hypothetical protein